MIIPRDHNNYTDYEKNELDLRADKKSVVNSSVEN